MIIDINLYNFMVMAACRLSLLFIADYLCKLHYYFSIDDM
jgi:hypothetical protein